MRKAPDSAQAGEARNRGVDTSVLQSVARTLIDRPIDDMNMQAMSRLAGVSLWALRYRYGTFGELFKAAATYVLDEAERELVFSSPRQESVIEAIRHYATSLRTAVASRAYRDMLLLVLRHGSAHPWLREAYDRCIAGRACAGLAETVLKVSERRGAPVLFKDGEARRFHRKVESEFALRSLLSPLDNLPDDQSEMLLNSIVREAFAGTYCFDWQAADAA